MIWTPGFADGPLSDLDAAEKADLLDLRLLDRSGEPPEVLYVEWLEHSYAYRVVEPPLPVGANIYMYCLVRLAGAIALYQFVGQTGARN